MAKSDIPNYYEDGHRMIRDGAPCRVARKPSENMRRILRDEKPFDPVQAQVLAATYEAPGFRYSKDGE